MHETGTSWLDPAERRDRLRLIRTENVGPATFFQLIERLGSAIAALEALPRLAARGGRRKPLRICPPAAVTEEIGALEALGGRHLHWGEPAYPSALAAVADAPPVLTALGRIDLD